MANIYLSFLGTNPYVPCTYYQGEREVPNVRFVQEATIQLFCKEWTDQDRILIFTTDQAQAENWVNRTIPCEDGSVSSSEGLKSRLERLNLPVPFKNIPIPDGKTVDQIWEIFSCVFDQLKDRDQIVFDITHAFRSIPMLAIVILHYSKVVKKIALKGIYYGAFEVLGNPQNAKKIPLERRRAPIFDLTPFDNLLEWTVALDRFLESGDAGHASSLAKRTVSSKLAESKGQNKAARNVCALADRLNDFTKNLSTCRGPKLMKNLDSMMRSVHECMKTEIPGPMKPLINRLIERIGVFSGDEIVRGLQASNWCLEHNLIQQGFTILQETLISYLVRCSGADCLNVEHRRVASQSVKIVDKELKQNEWESPARDHPDLAVKFFPFVQNHPEFVKHFISISDIRNDLNHAGYRKNARPAKRFINDLKKYIHIFEEMIIE